MAGLGKIAEPWLGSNMGNYYGGKPKPTPAPAPERRSSLMDIGDYNEQERRRRERQNADMNYELERRKFGLDGGMAGGGSGSSRSVSGGGGSGRPDPGSSEWNSRLASITSLMNQYAPGTPRVSRTSGATAGQEKAARDAAFARAKEKAGQTARASMASLDDVVASQGLMGSTIEGAARGNVIGQAAGSVNDFLTKQAIEEADHASEIADTEYMGQVSQRNAEQQRQQAILSLLMGAMY